MSELPVTLNVMESFVIDCSACRASEEVCRQCLMSALALPGPAEPVSFSQEEKDALEIMVEAGLIPALQLAVQ